MTRRLTFIRLGEHEFPIVGQRSPVRPTAAPAPSPCAAGAAPTSRPVAAMTAGREHKQAASDRGVGLAATYVSPTGRGSRRG